MKKSNRTADGLTCRHFWEVSKKHKKLFYLSLLLPLNALMLYTIAPFFVGKILASLLLPDIDITPYLIGFAVAAITGVIINRISFISLFELQPKVMRELNEEALKMLLARGSSYHNSNVSGRLVSDANEYPESYNQLSNALLLNILPFGMIIISGLLVISFSSPLLGLLMLIMSTVTIGLGLLQRKAMAEPRLHRIAASKAVTSHLSDVIVNNQAVKTFSRERQELLEHGKLGDKLRDLRIENWGTIARQGSSRILYLMLFQAAFILLTVWLVRRDPSLIATSIFAFSYTITLTNRLFEIGNIMRILEDALQKAEPMTLALQEEAEVRDDSNAIELTTRHGAIEFKDVNFTYRDNKLNSAVLKNFNIKIAAGERIGLVGPSGGGKSTITKLLLRFEDIQQGKIMVDGQEITKVKQSSLRSAITYVPQESLLFHRTIRENIAYGDSKASVTDIETAAKQAHAHEFISYLPHGYETVVGERGVKLSGGQRQRVAIARALLKHAPILVLDEATSALDSESEVAIQDALWKLMEGKTALVIAHRLSTIQKMDRILVLNKGKIEEAGSHDDLLKNGGLYARLWHHQSGGFMK